MNIAAVTFELHIAIDLLDVNQAGFGFELQFRFFGNGELEIGFEFERLRGSIENIGVHVDAVTGLFNVESDLVGRLRTDDVYLVSVFPGLHLDAAAGYVVNDDDRVAGDIELFFDALASGARGRDTGKQKADGKDRQ